MLLRLIESGIAVYSPHTAFDSAATGINQQLAAALELPLRERNRLLLAGGYAPHFPEQALNDESMGAARQAVQSVLDGHDPFPALAVDRHWNLLMSNRSAERLLEMVSPDLLVPPVNVL